MPSGNSRDMQVSMCYYLSSLLILKIKIKIYVHVTLPGNMSHSQEVLTYEVNLMYPSKPTEFSRIINDKDKLGCENS